MPRFDNSLSRCRRSRTLLRKIPFCPSDTHTAIALLLSEYIPTTDKAWVFPDWLDARLWLWQRPVSTVSATARLQVLIWRTRHRKALAIRRSSSRTIRLHLIQDVIEHVEDPNALLSELDALLAPGGHILIGTPVQPISINPAYPITITRCMFPITFISTLANPLNLWGRQGWEACRFLWPTISHTLVRSERSCLERVPTPLGRHDKFRSRTDQTLESTDLLQIYVLRDFRLLAWFPNWDSHHVQKTGV